MKDGRFPIRIKQTDLKLIKAASKVEERTISAFFVRSTVRQAKVVLNLPQI